MEIVLCFAAAKNVECTFFLHNKQTSMLRNESVTSNDVNKKSLKLFWRLVKQHNADKIINGSVH